MDMLSEALWDGDGCVFHLLSDFPHGSSYSSVRQQNLRMISDFAAIESFMDNNAAC